MQDTSSRIIKRMSFFVSSPIDGEDNEGNALVSGIELLVL